MNFLKNLKIGQRLGVAFGVLLSLTMALGGFAAYELKQVNQTSTDMEVNWMPSVRVVSALNIALGDFRIAEQQHVIAGEASAKATAERNLAEVAKELQTESAVYDKLISDADERQRWQAFQSAWAAYLAQHAKVLELSRADQTEQAKAVLEGPSLAQFEAASKALDDLVELNVQGGIAASQQGDVLYVQALAWLTAFIALSLALGVAAAVVITRSVTRPIDEAVRVAQTVAAGDLTSVIEVSGRDETADLLRALKAMNESLATTVGQVRAGADSIATGSNQIAIGNNDLSQRTEEQASNLEQTAASMEELTSTVRQNADTARQATQLAASASEAAAAGGAVVHQVVSTMQAISDSSRKISDIISVIDGIAFQTNILALNAAVEAARAGEQGRGFAVVAGEVRNLAQRSAEAAKEIKTLIVASVENVETGTTLADNAGRGMDDIVSQVKRVTDLIAEISAASAEQTQGISQVGDAVAQLDQVTQQNAALVEESAAAADSLKEQAARLAQVVQVFRISADAAPSATATRSVSAPIPAPAPRTASKPTQARVALAANRLAPTALKRPSIANKATPSQAAAPKAVATTGDEGDWESF